jgi:hypothetical protein
MLLEMCNISIAMCNIALDLLWWVKRIARDVHLCNVARAILLYVRTYVRARTHVRAHACTYARTYARVRTYARAYVRDVHLCNVAHVLLVIVHCQLDQLIHYHSSLLRSHDVIMRNVTLQCIREHNEQKCHSVDTFCAPNLDATNRVTVFVMK